MTKSVCIVGKPAPAILVSRFRLTRNQAPGRLALSLPSRYFMMRSRAPFKLPSSRHRLGSEDYGRAAKTMVMA